jgi:hypothetical protein
MYTLFTTTTTTTNDIILISSTLTLSTFLFFFSYYYYYHNHNRLNSSPSQTQVYNHHTLLWQFLDFLLELPFVSDLLGYPTSKPTIDFFLSEATRTTNGLTDFGSIEFLPLLQANLDDIYSPKTKLSALGRMYVLRRAKKSLVKRLRVMEYHKQHPDASRLDIPQPIFIIGCWRTGTTALQKYLDLDPQGSAYKHWELSQGLLSPQRSSQLLKKNPEICGTRSDPRAVEQANEVALFKSIFAELYEAHDIESDQPDECYEGLMDCMIPEASFLARHLFPNTFKAVQDLENTEFVYKNYKLLLQAFEHQKLTISRSRLPSPTGSNSLLKLSSLKIPRQFTVFKAPSNTPFLSEILSAFPNAKFVWTHRDMRKALPSFASLSLKVHYFLTRSERTTLQEGKETMEYLSQAMSRWIQIRKTIETELYNSSENVTIASEFVDFYYRDFVQNPIESLRGLYNHLGLEFTKEMEGIIESQEKRDAELRHGSGKKKLHKYTMEGYGLTEGDFEKGFGGYETEYKVPREGKRMY